MFQEFLFKSDLESDFNASLLNAQKNIVKFAQSNKVVHSARYSFGYSIMFLLPVLIDSSLALLADPVDHDQKYVNADVLTGIK